jgi:branched-chain amino acid transport system permease protein
MHEEIRYILQQLLNGLSVGSTYALMAVGYTMVYSCLRLINFVHGDVYVFGTFIALGAWQAGLPIALAILVGCVGGGLIGMGVERFAYRPLRHSHRVMSIIAGLGAAMVLRTAAQLIWGPQTLSFFQLGERRAFVISDLRIMSQQIQVVGGAAAVMVLFTLLLKNTRIGKATQCVMQDIGLSRMMGIPVNKIIPMVYALGGVLAVVGGVLYSSYYDAINIQMGMLGTIKAWAAAALGGMGSLYGAFWGGILLGVGETMAGAYLHQGFRASFGYLMIIVVLLYRPQGLFGTKHVEKV